MFKSISPYYEESGKVPPAGFIIALSIGILTALALSFVYAYAISYIPFIYLNFLLTGLFGVVIGAVVAMSAGFGKIRNRKVVIALAVVAALVACYMSWVLAVYLWLDSEVFIFNPSDLLTIIQVVAQEGVWSLKGATPTGAALYAIWGIEAAVIFGASFFGAIGAYSAEPFCENCNEWTKVVELTERLEEPEDFTAFLQGLEAKNYAVLTTLRNKKSSEPVKMKVDLLTCSSCSKVHYLRITLNVRGFDDNGKEEMKGTIIMDNLLIDQKTHQQLMDWQKKLDEKSLIVKKAETDTTELPKENDKPLDV
jgi:uncharacterized membrane protein YvlD (DUF360 family)